MPGLEERSERVAAFDFTASSSSSLKAGQSIGKENPSRTKLACNESREIGYQRVSRDRLKPRKRPKSEARNAGPGGALRFELRETCSVFLARETGMGEVGVGWWFGRLAVEWRVEGVDGGRGFISARHLAARPTGVAFIYLESIYMHETSERSTANRACGSILRLPNKSPGGRSYGLNTGGVCSWANP